MTQFERIFKTLKEHGIDIYPPSTKKGECLSPYTVLKYDGSSQIEDYSSEYHYYTFMFYVPKDRYTDLEKYRNEVKKILDENLYPMLMPTASDTPDFYDDTVKAHMSSSMYRNSVRNKHL